MKKYLKSMLCVLMVMLTVAFSLPAITVTAHAAALAAPANVKASQTTSQLSLTWDAAENATGYRIYYKNGKTWKACKDVQGTSVTFKNLPSGKAYTLAVRSFYKCKCHPKSTTWSKTYATIETATMPAAPAKVTAKATPSSLTLNWTASKGATGYKIYYYRIPSGWKELTSTTKTTCTFTKMVTGCEYKFAIKPYIKLKDGTVIEGNAKEFTAAASTTAPKATVTSPEKGKVVIKWSKVYAADGYYLYYKYNNGKYKLIKDVANPAEIVYTNIAGGNYTFAVRAYINTTCGKIFSPYTPVTVAVKGNLPCGCAPECCRCGKSK